MSELDPSRIAGRETLPIRPWPDAVIDGVAEADDGPRLQAIVGDPAGNALGVWQNADGS